MPRRPLRSFEEFVGFVKDRGFLPGTVIDVGACHGTPELLHGFPDAYHVLFEPVAELEARMRLITSKVRGEYHIAALGRRARRMPLSVPVGAPEGASLLCGTGHPTREVEVTTLDTVFRGRKLAGPILLKTDCQGLDLDVMQGGRAFLKQVDLIVMEVNLFHPGGDRGRPDFGAILGWMTGAGFSVYDILSYQTRPFDDALGYVDLAFVKTAGAFRAHHRWQ